MSDNKPVQTLRDRLLDWYDTSGRKLPWRVRPEDREAGLRLDPYKVWLSEIMLQQTTVPHATPYWLKFIEIWPTVEDLANAERDRVLTEWAGLGYYARARNLHKCAQVVANDLHGVFPDSEAGLLKLPGIGPYTAAAIAALCFDEATSVVDGNVERVISRLFALKTPLPKVKPEIREKAAMLASPDRPGDYAQALMDLGATVCRPKSPLCETCVWRDWCDGYSEGEPESYPRREKKKELPTRKGAVFVLLDGDEVLLRQRPDEGLLGGMMEFPGTEWTGEGPSDSEITAAAPIDVDWQTLDGEVRHIFTHFALTLSIYTAQLPEGADRPEGTWAQTKKLDSYALPSLMQKVWKMSQP